MSRQPNNKKGKRPGRDMFGRQLLEPPPPETTSASGSGSTPASTTSAKPKGLTKLKQAILKASNSTPGGLKAIQEEIADIATRIIQRKNPLTEKHYANAKSSWEICVEALADPEIIADVWETRVIRRFATQYIPFRVRVTDGRKAGHVQAITAAGWCAHIIVCIASYAHDDETGQKCGGILLYSEGFAKKLEDSVWTAIREYDLNRLVSVRGQQTFGPFEIQICMEHVMRTHSRARLARLQEVCSLIFPLGTGIRPSGLAAGHAEFAKHGQYLKLGDLEIISRGPTAWDIKLTIKNHKAILYIWHRGALPKYETLQQLMLTEDDKLEITLPNEPFFVSCAPGTSRLTKEPLSTRQLSERVKTLAIAAGLSPKLTYYDIRRDFADEVSIKLGGQQASLILGHQDASSTLTESYSFGPGNIDVLGVRTGEVSEEFLPGTVSRLELRRRTGTAINMISKALAMYAQPQESEDEQGDDSQEESDTEAGGIDVNEALEKLKKKNNKLIGQARKDALTCPDVARYKKNALQLWDNYLACFRRGSPLYESAAEFKPAKQNIGKIEKLEEYAELAKAKREKAEKASAMVMVDIALTGTIRKTSRAAATHKREQLDYELTKYNNDTYKDKNKAIKHVKNPSGLVVAAALGSKEKQDQLDAMNQEDDDTATELAISSYKSAFNYNYGRLAGNRDQHTNPELRKLLKETAKSVGIESPEQVEDEPPSAEQQDEEEEDEEDIPVEEVWKDKDATEIVEGVDIVPMRRYLMMMVSGPILFEQRCKKDIEDNGGKLLCPNCREFLPEDTLTNFTSVSNLRKHMRNVHTDWKDLKYKMASGPNTFKCPGACSSDQKFESVDAVRKHCLSPKCIDQRAFLDMKASHDKSEKLRKESRKDEIAGQKTDLLRNRRKIRAQQTEYYASLDRSDILELADEFKIPRHEVEPFIERMLAITGFIREMLL